MKYFLYKIVFLFVVLPVYLTANVACLSPYKCEIKGKKINGAFVPARARNCKVPMMPNMPIVPEDIFDTNGELKYYFGTGKTVCDVLGWMNEGASHFKDVKGMD